MANGDRQDDMMVEEMRGALGDSGNGGAAAPDDATTPPDAADGHTHEIAFVDDEGNGATSVDGDPPHAHAVVGGEILPAAIDGYVSEHDAVDDAAVNAELEEAERGDAPRSSEAAI